MVRRGQEPVVAPSFAHSCFPFKKNSASILADIQQLWQECRPGFDQQRLADLAEALSLSTLMCLGRHTITAMLTTCGMSYHDWTAPYRLFSWDRLPLPHIFSVIRHRVLTELPPQAPLCVALDDSLLRKTGIRIPGVAWRRDPLGPRFQTNLVLAQRCLQISADVPLPSGDHRMIPIAFHHAPTPVKPSPKASPEAQADYLQKLRQQRLPRRASQQITRLRQDMDKEPDGRARLLYVFVDNGHTNRTVLKDLPERTVLVGRMRKDAKLYFLPSPSQTSKTRGRPRHYGDPAPTPDQVRTDDSIPWQTVSITIAATTHQMRVKICRNLLWRAAGLHHILQLVVIAPLAYRLRKGSKLLYRQPAFLLCTDAQLDLVELLQGYVRRWDIEVNFREEKTLFGVGEAQVRDPQSVETVPAFQVASYAMLLLATIRTCQATTGADRLPPPKWAASQTPSRVSTQQARNQLRAETWGRALGLTNFSDLLTSVPVDAKSQKFLPHLPSAVLYAQN